MSKPSKWALVVEGGVEWIRRRAGGKYERLPINTYRRLRGNPTELRGLVSRLNYQLEKQERAKVLVDFKHAFISPELLESYREFLIAQIPTKESAKHEYNFVLKHFLMYFIQTKGLADPLEWHAIHKTKWKDYICSLGLAPASLRRLIQGANRFCLWLHEQRPAEVKPLVFTPITKAGFKHLRSKHELENGESIRRLVTDEEFAALKFSDEVVEALANLCSLYGLRRAEALGLKPEDVREDYLALERQMPLIEQYAPLKGRDKRKVPHWRCTASQAYAWVLKIRAMNPDTFGDEFALVTQGSFTLHDLRHTYITKMARAHNVRDVMMAVGHKNIETTMRYLKDDRALDSRPYRP